jgi:hypothetical protein
MSRLNSGGLRRSIEEREIAVSLYKASDQQSKREEGEDGDNHAVGTPKGCSSLRFRWQQMPEWVIAVSRAHCTSPTA